MAFDNDVLPTPIGPSTVINGTDMRSPPSSLNSSMLFILSHELVEKQRE